MTDLTALLDRIEARVAHCADPGYCGCDIGDALAVCAELREKLSGSVVLSRKEAELIAGTIADAAVVIKLYSDLHHFDRLLSARTGEAK